MMRIYSNSPILLQVIGIFTAASTPIVWEWYSWGVGGTILLYGMGTFAIGAIVDYGRR